MTNVLTHCNQLTTFFLTENSDDDRWMVTVAQHLSGTIRTLIVRGRVTDEVLCAISLHCPLLETFDLSKYFGRHAYTMNGITELAHNCGHLTTLYVPNSCKVVTEGVAKLWQVLRHEVCITRCYCSSLEVRMFYSKSDE